MIPSLYPGNSILVSKYTRIKLHDIVVLKNPQKSDTVLYLIKRVKKIKKNAYFVVGDNMQESKDSRAFGWIEKKDILGKMIQKLPTREKS